ncbi:hypothetical protein [Streptomyces sp. CS081A]|uniref:hypothetical protein n=1 Tax=Streptomyces sp. CS081A TaxID=2162709 RepID=UPI000D5143B9|nr:hypothetical protein [Streptomyces sp. CS081A]PVC71897.1 hypothetical protein DBP18_17665 [Streptomyces sp. CS081A]
MASMQGAGHWRASVVDHRRAEGLPPYERARPAGEPLARRGDLAVHGSPEAITLRAAARGGGRFVLGLEGYGEFVTREYDREGAETDRWPSYGHYVVGTGLRVVEADRRLPTGNRVVRLLPGGTVVPGPPLSDPQPPKPVVLPDGTVLLLDGPAVRAVGRDLDTYVLADLGPAAGPRAAPTVRALRRDGDGLVAVVAEQHAAEPTRYTVDTWTLTLRGGA